MVRPVPIPNTAVKHSLADGSGFIDSARVGCRQFLLKGPRQLFRPFFFSRSASAVRSSSPGLFRPVNYRALDGVEDIVQALPQILGEEPEHEIPALLECGILSAVAPVGFGIS